MRLSATITITAVSVLALGSSNVEAKEPTIKKSSTAPTASTAKAEKNATLVRAGTLKGAQVIGFKRGVASTASGSSPKPIYTSASRPCLPETDGNCTLNPDPEPVWQRIVTTGEREYDGQAYEDGWMTVCRGWDCAGIDAGEAMPDPSESTSASIGEALESWLIDKTGVDDKTQNACTTEAALIGTAAQKDLIRNTTSQQGSDSGARLAAASAAWFASQEMRTTNSEHASISPSGILRQFAYGMNGGYTVTMTYADGGTEQFKYQVTVSLLTPVENSLVPGTGVSACPA